MSAEIFNHTDSATQARKASVPFDTDVAKPSYKSCTILTVCLVVFALLFGGAATSVGALGLAQIVTTIPYSVSITLVAVGILVLLGGIVGMCARIRAHKGESPKNEVLKKNEQEVKDPIPTPPKVEEKSKESKPGPLTNKAVTTCLSHICYALSSNEERETILTQKKPDNFESTPGFSVSVDYLFQENKHKYVWDELELKVFLNVKVNGKTSFLIYKELCDKETRGYEQSDQSDVSLKQYIDRLKGVAQNHKEDIEVEIQMVFQSEKKQYVKSVSIQVPEKLKHFSPNELKTKIDIYFEPGLIQFFFKDA